MKPAKVVLFLAAVLTAALPAFSAEESPAVDLAAETATHEEVAPLAVKFDKLSALRLYADGNLLACDAESKQIKIIDPDGRQVATIELEFAPEAIDVADDGTIYCGGQGQLAKLNADGQVLKCVQLPTKEPPSGRAELRPTPRRPPTGMRPPSSTASAAATPRHGPIASRASR